MHSGVPPKPPLKSLRGRGRFISWFCLEVLGQSFTEECGG